MLFHVVLLGAVAKCETVIHRFKHLDHMVAACQITLTLPTMLESPGMARHFITGSHLVEQSSVHRCHAFLPTLGFPCQYFFLLMLLFGWVIVWWGEVFSGKLTINIFALLGYLLTAVVSDPPAQSVVTTWLDCLFQSQAT